MNDIGLIRQNYILCQEVKQCLARIDRIIAQRDEAIEKLYEKTERLKVSVGWRNN